MAGPLAIPFIAKAALGLAAIYGFGWAAKETGEAAESMSKLTKYGIVAGGLYVSYRALKSSGALK